MANFQFALPARIQFGLGEVEQLGGSVSRLGKKARLVAGKSSMRRTGVLDKVLANLKAQNVSAVVFDEVFPNPTSEEV
jgi:alcohol dehydrogenase